MSDQTESMFNSAPTEASVDEFVGEGKKYKTAEDALRSIPHAQSHIQSLESTLEELRADLSKRVTLEEVVAQMRETQSQGTEAPLPPALDENKITELLEQKLTQREIAKMNSDNKAKVAASISQAFGEKAESVYNEKARQLGLTPTELNALAGRSPEAVLAYFPELKARPTGQGVSSGSVNTEAFSTSSTAKEGSYAFYSAMRKTDPKRYYSREVQIEITQKAASLGPDFYK